MPPRKFSASVGVENENRNHFKHTECPFSINQTFYFPFDPDKEKIDCIVYLFFYVFSFCISLCVILIFQHHLFLVVSFFPLFFLFFSVVVTVARVF